MAEKLGIPLLDIVGFPVDLADRLAELWITTADEFYNAADGDGALGLAEHLGISEDNVRALSDLVLPDVARRWVGPVEFPGLGALDDEPGADPAEAPAAGPGRGPLPSMVNLIAGMPPVRDQKDRGTCVAFSCTAVREFLLGPDASAAADLSEQFLYWACKERDNWSGEGTWIKIGMEVLQAKGICPEPVWPYNPRKVAGSEGQGPAPDAAQEAAVDFRISKGELLQARWVDSMKRVLAEGRPIAFAVPVYRYWLTEPVRSTGDVRMPLANEQSIGGHAMTMVGYEDDASVPGGGYFMIRNSWGEVWASDSALGAGYARLPYEFISKLGRSAYSAHAPEPEPKPQPEPEPKPQPEQPASNWLIEWFRKLFQRPPGN